VNYACLKDAKKVKNRVKLGDRTWAFVIKAINSIKRETGKEAFKRMFKSITLDNGSEFLDYKALERSV